MTEELETKNHYLNSTIEKMKKNEEELKNQKKKIEENFRKEIEEYTKDLSDVKCEFTSYSFQKERELAKLYRYINNLQNKMKSI